MRKNHSKEEQKCNVLQVCEYEACSGGAPREKTVDTSEPEYEASVKSDVLRRSERTAVCFEDVADGWLEYKRIYVKKSTYVRYRYLLEKHIYPCFGCVNILQIHSGQVESMVYEKYAGKQGRGLAEKTIQDILSVFKAIISYAEEKGYIPTGGMKIKIPHFIVKKQKKIITVIPVCERLIFEDHLMRNLHKPREFGILLALYTGLRIGEICALRWKDIDLKNNLLCVNHTLLRLHDYSDDNERKTTVVLETPKTPSSYRTIPLSSFFAEQLTRMYRQGRDDEDYLLSAGRIPEEPRSYLYFYKRQLELCGLPPYNFHALRHTFATRCVEEGFDIKSLSEILGHSNVKITMDRYVHPSLEVKRRQMELLTIRV